MTTSTTQELAKIRCKMQRQLRLQGHRDAVSRINSGIRARLLAGEIDELRADDLMWSAYRKLVVPKEGTYYCRKA